MEIGRLDGGNGPPVIPMPPSSKREGPFTNVKLRAWSAAPRGWKRSAAGCSNLLASHPETLSLCERGRRSRLCNEADCPRGREQERDPAHHCPEPHVPPPVTHSRGFLPPLPLLTPIRVDDLRSPAPGDPKDLITTSAVGEEVIGFVRARRRSAGRFRQRRDRALGHPSVSGRSTDDWGRSRRTQTGSWWG